MIYSNRWVCSKKVYRSKKLVYFDIYSREQRPQKISKMKITGFIKYLSFVGIGNRVRGFSVLSKDTNYCKEIYYKVNEAEDTRITKYSYSKSDDLETYYISSRMVDLISSRYIITKDTVTSKSGHMFRHFIFR